MTYTDELIWGRKKKRKKRGTKREPSKHGKKKTKRKPVRQEVQRKIGARSNDKCEYCSRPLSGNAFRGIPKVGSQLHHIDRNPANNKMDNLILLCPNCHDRASRGEISKRELRNRISRFRFRL